MTAAGRSLTDVYLDTTIPFATIMVGSPHHQAARAFSDRIIRGECNIYISQFLPLELLQALRVIANDPRLLPEITRLRYRLAHWGTDLDVRRKWIDDGVEKFDKYLGGFANVFELPMRSEDWRNSIALMAQYRLKSYDAYHAASALALGVRDFATIDGHFTRVSELNVHLVRDPAPTVG